MAEIRVVVRRIAIEKAVRRIPASDYVERVGTFELAALQPVGKNPGKTVPLAVDFTRGGIGGDVKSPAAVEHTGEGLRTEYPDSPCPLDVGEKLGVVVDDPGLAVQVTAVERDTYLCLQPLEVFLGHPVEVDQFEIGVIDYLDLGGVFGEEDGRAADEEFAVEGMARYEGYDACGELLLPTIITNGCP